MKKMWYLAKGIKKQIVSLNITFNEKNVIFSEMNKKPNYFAKYQFQWQKCDKKRNGFVFYHIIKIDKKRNGFVVYQFQKNW